MKVGLVGWRGMVGSVLMKRMRDEQDFSTIDPVFFSTSNAGAKHLMSASRRLCCRTPATLTPCP